MSLTVARYNLAELVEMIDGPNKLKCRAILMDHGDLFKRTYGSTHNHQNWPGGYWDHIVEVMNRAVFEYRVNPRPFPFSLSDSLLVLFLHDLEKPWKYKISPGGLLVHNYDFKTDKDQHDFVRDKISECGIILTPEHENALYYVHGEGDDYSNERRIMGPLAAFCHICDVWVARIDFDFPLANNDPW